MRQFLKAGARFFILILLIVTVIFFSISFIIQRSIKEFKVAPDINTLVLGDSHIKLAIDPEIFRNSVSYAQHSEPYLFTYEKLQSILKTNNQIKKVYVGFSYHNLSSIYDDVLQADKPINVIPQYFFLLRPALKAEFFRKNLFKPVLWDHILREGLRIVFQDTSRSILGGYENYFEKVEFNDSSIIKRIKFHYYNNGKTVQFSNTNIYYLKEIIRLCKESNVELFFLKTPLHPNYEKRVPLNYVLYFNEFVLRNQMRVIDFNEVHLLNSDFVQDGDHVTKEGALKLSSYLNQLSN